MSSAQTVASTEEQVKRPYIGGQAVLEGVMMRSPHSFAITNGWPFWITETQEYEVPRSIPMARRRWCGAGD